MKTLIATTLLVISMTAAAQHPWIVTPRHGGMQTIIDPSGKHHTIIYPTQRRQYQPQPGWTQYSNPVDAFMQSYRRGAEWRQWLDSTR